MTWSISEVCAVVGAATAVSLLVVTVWYARTVRLEYNLQLQDRLERGLPPPAPPAPNTLRRLADRLARPLLPPPPLALPLTTRHTAPAPTAPTAASTAASAASSISSASTSAASAAPTEVRPRLPSGKATQVD
ncbi:hypothetical protein BKA66DRAFT_439888 [Pyrenochaeta sp. MPI-SDFR-AT-0127]|nr:hypothetical protein BKA66DRAFT_439888 [Pyrenochaeta sp. MPI-SDFR-AT-0127]